MKLGSDGAQYISARSLGPFARFGLTLHLRKHRYLLHGSHLALEFAGRALSRRSTAGQNLLDTRAWHQDDDSSARACFGATGALEMAAMKPLRSHSVFEMEALKPLRSYCALEIAALKLLRSHYTDKTSLKADREAWGEGGMEFTWFRLASLCFIWFHLNSLGFT